MFFAPIFDYETKLVLSWEEVSVVGVPKSVSQVTILGICRLIREECFNDWERNVIRNTNCK